MKITNILLAVAVAGSLAGCDKKADTANPGDAAPDAGMDAPATDDADMDDMDADDADMDDMGGEEGGDEAAGEGGE